MFSLSKTTHHATLFVDENRKEITSILMECLKRDQTVYSMHDLSILDIDTARIIASWAQAPYDGNKVILLSFHTATIPAQNALLKVLEEPNTGVYFIIVTSNLESIIPTLYSRLQLQQHTSQGIQRKDSELFLETSTHERMKLTCVTSLLTAKDESGRKDREGLRIFILSLVELLKRKNADHRYILQTIEVASYASDTSSSGKALIEYLALLLPQIKS